MPTSPRSAALSIGADQRAAAAPRVFGRCLVGYQIGVFGRCVVIYHTLLPHTPEILRNTLKFRIFALYK